MTVPNLSATHENRGVPSIDQRMKTGISPIFVLTLTRSLSQGQLPGPWSEVLRQPPKPPPGLIIRELYMKSFRKPLVCCDSLSGLHPAVDTGSIHKRRQPAVFLNYHNELARKSCRRLASGRASVYAQKTGLLPRQPAGIKWRPGADQADQPPTGGKRPGRGDAMPSKICGKKCPAQWACRSRRLTVISYVAKVRTYLLLLALSQLAIPFLAGPTAKG
jgi:hypothetical protein